jgi:hypothetical protein
MPRGPARGRKTLSVAADVRRRPVQDTNPPSYGGGYKLNLNFKLFAFLQRRGEPRK